MRPAQNLADVWRLEPGGAGLSATVREAQPADFARIRELQLHAQPAIEPASYQQLEHQVDAFPEGQLVAIADGEIVGFASSVVVQWDHYALDHTWKSITGEGFFTTHDPVGKTLYGVELVVDPRRKGEGLGRMLTRARRRLCARMNLRRIITDARLAGYREVREAMTPEVYAQRVIWGDRDDALLRFHLASGFQYCGVIRDFRPEDIESCGHAALFVGLSQRYVPT